MDGGVTTHNLVQGAGQRVVGWWKTVGEGCVGQGLGVVRRTNKRALVKGTHTRT